MKAIPDAPDTHVFDEHILALANTEAACKFLLKERDRAIKERDRAIKEMESYKHDMYEERRYRQEDEKKRDMSIEENTVLRDKLNEIRVEAGRFLESNSDFVKKAHKRTYKQLYEECYNSLLKIYRMEGLFIR